MGFLAALASPNAHNKGKTQVGFNFPGLGYNEFPYIDYVRFAGPMIYGGSTATYPSNSPVAPDNVDANGYPITIQAGGYYLQIDIPPTLASGTNTAKTGQFVLAWKGTGTLNIVGLVSNTTATNGRVLFTPASSTTVTRLNVAVSSMDSVDYITKISVYALSDETAYTNGVLWNPDFITRLKQGNHGVLRFMNWLQNNTTNMNTWSSRKGKDYYSQAADEIRTSLWAGETTLSGFDYAVTFGSGAPVHGTMLQLRYGGTYTPVSSGTIASFSGNAIPWAAHGFSGGEIVSLTSGSGAPSTTRWVGENLYVLAAGLTANSFQVSLTAGGSAVNLGTVGSSTNCLRLPTLNLNASRKIAIRNKVGDPFSGPLRKVNAGDGKALFATVVYDADFDAWLNFGADIDGSYTGITSGISPEHMLDLCIAVGAHPWINFPYLALDPATDYVTGMATFFRNNAPSWMIPRYEGINEQWNFGGGFYGTRYGWSKGFFHWGTYFDQDNFQGKIVSTFGQDILAVYGGKLDSRRFWVVDGCQFGGFANLSPSAQADRFKSTQYVNQAAAAQSGYVKAPAYLYSTHLCIANYWNSSYIDTGQVGTGSITSNTLAMAGRDNSNNNTYVPAIGDKVYLQGSTSVPSGTTPVAVATITAVNSYTSATGAGNYTVTSTSDAGSQKIVIGPDLSEVVMALKYFNNPDSTLLDAYIGGAAFLGGRVDSLVGNVNCFIIARNAGKLYRNKDGYQLALTFYEGGFSPDFTSTSQVNAFRSACKKSPELIKTFLGGTLNNAQVVNGNYNDCLVYGSFPSMYQFAGASNAWSVLDPSIYVTPDPPQWTAATTFNS